MRKAKKVKKVQYRAKSVDGKMVINDLDRNAMKEVIKTHFAEKDLILTIEIDVKRRSLPRNNFYWGFVIPVETQGFIDCGTAMMGHDEQSYKAVHEWNKKMWCDNGYQLVDVHGEVRDIDSSTARLSNQDFDEYLEKIRQWCAENLSIQIPYRGEAFHMEQPQYEYRNGAWEEYTAQAEENLPKRG